MGFLPDDSIPRIRKIGFLEGLSFVALVLVGMPVKYLLGEPLLVKVFGPIHGGLFVWLAVELLRLVVGGDWPVKRAAVVFIASLLPFGPFVIDGWLKRQEEIPAQ